MRTILKLNHMLTKDPSHNHYGRNNTSFPFAPLRLCVRPFCFCVFFSFLLAACASGPPSRKSKPIVLIRESVAHKPPNTAPVVGPKEVQEETPKPPEKKGGAFTRLEPLKFEGAEAPSESLKTP